MGHRWAWGFRSRSCRSWLHRGLGVTATGLGWGRLSDTLSSAQVSALRRLAKPMSDRVAGRASQKPAMLDSGAEVSASTTSSEPESGARSVSSIVRQWNRKINNFLGDPSSSVNGARPARSGQGLRGWVARCPRAPVSGSWLVAEVEGQLLVVRLAHVQPLTR